jgi:hypothetical protein
MMAAARVGPTSFSKEARWSGVGTGAAGEKIGFSVALAGAVRIGVGAALEGETGAGETLEEEARGRLAVGVVREAAGVARARAAARTAVELMSMTGK